LTIASALVEMGMRRGRCSTPSVAAQSRHLKLLMLAEVVTATHGTRKASARMAPCMDSATISSDCAILRITAFASPRGSI
jgi:hypothetical protein